MAAASAAPSPAGPAPLLPRRPRPARRASVRAARSPVLHHDRFAVHGGQFGDERSRRRRARRPGRGCPGTRGRCCGRSRGALRPVPRSAATVDGRARAAWYCGKAAGRTASPPGRWRYPSKPGANVVAEFGLGAVRGQFGSDGFGDGPVPSTRNRRPAMSGAVAGARSTSVMRYRFGATITGRGSERSTIVGSSQGGLRGPAPAARRSRPPCGLGELLDLAGAQADRQLARDLGALDRVDAQVGFEVEVRLDQLRRIPRPRADHLDHGLQHRALRRTGRGLRTHRADTARRSPRPCGPSRTPPRHRRRAPSRAASSPAISARLIESTLRSASRSRSGSIMSAG